MEELYAILMIIGAIGSLLWGFPVALCLAGSSLLFAFLGYLSGHFDLSILGAFPSRMYGIMGNETLIAVPLFIFMGVLLERSGISEELLETMGVLLGGLPGGLGVSICIVGALLAASTGIVGATVVTMGLISLPSLLQHKYKPPLATGIICAAGTLGQIIPPSIILVILSDQIGAAHQQSLLERGIFSGETVSVGDLFAGSLIPGLILVLSYIIYILIYTNIKKDAGPPVTQKNQQSVKGDLYLRVIKSIVPPLLLILGVLGSILMGLSTPTEAASVGCMGSFGLALIKKGKAFNLNILGEVVRAAGKINCMVFFILIGASFFSLIFRGFSGDEMIREFLGQLPGGKWAAFGTVMLLMFMLGFFLDFFEITFIIVPIVGPILISMGFDPLLLGVLIAMNLQTSFLTPPFGFSLFYLRGVAPPSISTIDMYRGVIPFILIQLAVLLLLLLLPDLVTFLPKAIYS